MLVAAAVSSAGESGVAAEAQHPQRVSMAHAQIAGAPAKAAPAIAGNRRRPASMVAQAAGGRVPSEIPEAPLDGSLVRAQIAPVGFLDGCSSGCGPVCDCSGPGPTCGIEPSCGLQPISGIEPFCGVEPGCGIEGCLGCDDPSCGFEAACGVEASYGEVGCGAEFGQDCSCDACRNLDCIPVFLPLLRVAWCRFDFFAGVQGFKGPPNFANTLATDPDQRNGSGSFGFYQGFNQGHSLKRWLGWDMAAQGGVRTTQSNLSGAEFTTDTRHQVFLTAGLFRRVDLGLQYGLVFDYRHDDWWFQSDLTQLRGELSWNTGRCHSFGFQYMAGLGSDTSRTQARSNTDAVLASSVTFEPTDQYRFFYRRALANYGDWSGFAGFTDNDDGLLGASLNLPLRQRLALSTGATYLVPHEGTHSGGNRQESWNISLGLIFRPGGSTGYGRYDRPLFDVADNGTFLVDRQ